MEVRGKAFELFWSSNQEILWNDVGIHSSHVEEYFFPIIHVTLFYLCYIKHPIVQKKKKNLNVKIQSVCLGFSTTTIRLWSDVKTGK